MGVKFILLNVQLKVELPYIVVDIFNFISKHF